MCCLMIPVGFALVYMSYCWKFLMASGVLRGFERLSGVLVGCSKSTFIMTRNHGESPQKKGLKVLKQVLVASKIMPLPAKNEMDGGSVTLDSIQQSRWTSGDAAASQDL